MSDFDAQRALTAVLTEARRRGATHLHLEPIPGPMGRARARVGAHLEPVQLWGQAPFEALREHLLRLTGIQPDLSAPDRVVITLSHRDPQTQRDDSAPYHVETLPTLYGTKLVLTLLDTSRADSAAPLTLDRLGLTPEDLATAEGWLQARRRLVILGGPPQSGRNTFAATLLRRAVALGLRVASIETAPRHTIDGAEQRLYASPDVAHLALNDAVGGGAAGTSLDLQRRLPLLLREQLTEWLAQARPEVLFIQELWDAEFARRAMDLASKQGALVITTQHVAHAAQTLSALHGWGLDARGVLRTPVTIWRVQRLRRLCAQDATTRAMPERALRRLGFRPADLRPTPPSVWDAPLRGSATRDDQETEFVIAREILPDDRRAIERAWQHGHFDRLHRELLRGRMESLRHHALRLMLDRQVGLTELMLKTPAEWAPWTSSA